MSLKQNNEITVKIKGDIKDFYKIIEQKGFKQIRTFTLEDTYFIPTNIQNQIEIMTTRQILSKAVIIRNIVSKTTTKRITFKTKQIDEQGNILSQQAINCNIEDIESAKKLLQAIGYTQIMEITEHDKVYEKEGLELAVKEIENGYNLIEVETEDNEEMNTIEKLKSKINEIEIPIYTDNYFVKKAEIELNKILQREEQTQHEKSCGCMIIEGNKVLLVHQESGFWSFPKGHVEEGETEIQTAKREVKEETNLDVEIEDETKRYEIEYFSRKRKDKKVVFFVAKKVGGQETPLEGEIQQIKWVNFAEAFGTLTHENTKEILKQAIKDIGINQE